MKKVVIGWGSLIWCPKNLRIKDKNWREDGPKLPIEFAGISNDGRLTLVIYDEYLDQKDRWVQTLWTEMDVDLIEEAIENLRRREKTSEELIGYIYRVKKEFTMRDGLKIITYEEKNRGRLVEVLNEIRDWMIKKKFDVVIWTDLPSNFEEKTKNEVTENSVIRYLEKETKDCEREKAEEYVRNTPPQVQTRIRKVIEEKLEWTYEGNYR
ncbi:MAG: hypothetical protein ISS81_10710 [Candidatus Marinimicrobia bacterium]|nr:hypothetical protein [Candidatus Neomarinimicrobiota bacterium]